MFIETIKGEFINTDYIVSVDKSSADEDLWIIRDADGGIIGRVHDEEWRKAQEGHDPIVAASPGYFLLCVPEPEDIVDALSEPGQMCLRDPIIGWRGLQAIPVTLDGYDESQRSAILCPDGRVIEPQCTTYDSIAEFEAAMVRMALDAVDRSAKARKAKTAA
ncbi:hypothetical protein ASD45_19140 [Pseudolabrys sp. Root1462]|uniref:hypothetical protein n=1 Tax=Pseudolabrys sp. Root1462 TaxID=1736466 RepID=UPI00070391C4|nr:hypothetical protein [Pseudolabrys sp. Root1462]KQY98096.1 hypothetical protein ASD45_19140 [Pseudolabrys sp. Root1462]